MGLFCCMSQSNNINSANIGFVSSLHTPYALKYVMQRKLNLEINRQKLFTFHLFFAISQQREQYILSCGDVRGRFVWLMLLIQIINTPNVLNACHLANIQIRQWQERIYLRKSIVTARTKL